MIYPRSLRASQVQDQRVDNRRTKIASIRLSCEARNEKGIAPTPTFIRLCPSGTNECSLAKKLSGRENRVVWRMDPAARRLRALNQMEKMEKTCGSMENEVACRDREYHYLTPIGTFDYLCLLFRGAVDVIDAMLVKSKRRYPNSRRSAQKSRSWHFAKISGWSVE